MIYFLSDTHLGLNYGDKTPRQREKFLCDFLCSIEHDCSELFLVGDIFDFWFEWKRCVPQGFVQILAQLQKMTEQGITIHFLVGNHDLWIGKYLQQEIGIIVHTDHLKIQRQNKKLFITHGDKLYRHRGVSYILDKMFRSKFVRWVGQRIIHPDSMIRFGRGWSTSNRKKHGDISHQFTAEDDYWVKASKEILKEEHFDYFVYGHLHIPLVYELSESSTMVVLGEWIQKPTYATLNDSKIELHYIE